MKRRCLKNGGRPRAFWGALIANLAPAVIGLGTAIYQSNRQARLQREQIEEQRRAQQLANEANQANQNANSLNNYASAVDNYDENDDDYGLKYKSGGRRKLRNAGARIIDGGYAIPLDNNKSLLRGSLHSQVNESGKTGIGIKIGNKEIEAENGEVVQNKGNELRVFSAQPMLAGISPAQAIMQGANEDKIFKAQEAVKKRYHLRNGKSMPVERNRAVWGANFTTPDYIGLGVNTGLSLLSGVWGNSMYGDLLDDVNFTLPTYTDEMYVEGPSKWRNEAQRAAVLRNDINARRNIAENTASGNVSVGRMQKVGTDAMYELMKLADEKANKETEMAQVNANRQQEVRARNAQGRLNWSRAVADTLNQQNALRAQIGQAKISSNVGMLQGIGSAVGNFLQQGIDNYQADQARRMALAASPYGSAERAASMSVDFSPSIMRTLRDDAKTRIERFSEDTSESGIKAYNDALDSYNFWNSKLSEPLSLTRKKKALNNSNSKTYRPGIWYNPRTGQGQA